MDLKLTGLVKYKGKWEQPGTIIRKVDEEIGLAILDAKAAEKMVLQDDSDIELQALRDRAKELGIPNAGRLGEAKLKEAIADREAELEALRKKALELDIDGVYEKDEATLAAEVAADKQK